MPTFSGTLNSNIIFAALYNMIISQEVFADNVAGTFSSLVDKARVDGGLYGDTKLYYSTDALKSAAWGNDAEATNLLQLHRPAAPEVQAIFINTFRQISLTIDNYLTKQAFKDEGAFGQFNSVMLGWMRVTKRVYDSTLYNVYIGTTVSTANRAVESIDLSTIASDSSLNTEEKNRLKGQTIAQSIADLIVALKDITRDFNDYKYLRSYDESSINFVWNAKWVNQIKKIDLPTIFHKDGLISKFDEDLLPARYFGVVITSSNKSSYAAATPTTGKPIDSDDNTYVPGVNHANGCIRSVVEKEVTVGGTSYHVFPGDEIPAGSTIVASGTFELGEVYIETADVICKIYVKLPPFMSAFEAGTSFFNPRSLTETHFLTWGHNTIEYLKNYPFITVKAA